MAAAQHCPPRHSSALYRMFAATGCNPTTASSMKLIGSRPRPRHVYVLMDFRDGGSSRTCKRVSTAILVYSNACLWNNSLRPWDSQAAHGEYVTLSLTKLHRSSLVISFHICEKRGGKRWLSELPSVMPCNHHPADSKSLQCTKRDYPSLQHVNSEAAKSFIVAT
jgi:hypothetical protein